jgi:protein O-mannosyl-transferase
MNPSNSEMSDENREGTRHPGPLPIGSADSAGAEREKCSQCSTLGTNRHSSRLFVLICLVLALGTAALYWPITKHPFINFDDWQYVVENSHVNTGLSGTNTVWAFTTSEQANWHPATWLSHQLDCSLFGLNAGAHHFVNLLFHVTNTLLLFIFLRRATGALWRGAFVAALFAWHPMHVESVAWVSERKDVLSTFFWLLTLLAYLRYANSTIHDAGSAPPATRHPSLYYFAALLFCALGLMSKPMVVTLPFVLLLLDLWPLRRISNLKFEISNYWRLVREKIPFFALVIASCAVTYLVQDRGGAVAKTAFGENLANAALAYPRYIAKLILPTDLAIVYPHPKHWPLLLALGAMFVLAAWTYLCVRDWRQRPFLAVGWLWFLGTLVPTIGLVQVGAASMADRYTYVPSIGFFLVIVWGATAWFANTARQKAVLSAGGGVALLACAWLTLNQISYWRDSIAVFRHALEVTTDNYVAENCLGKAYEGAGDNARALVCFQASVAHEPRFPNSQFNLAMNLLTIGRTAEAFEHLQAAAGLVPRDPDIQYDLGIYFAQHGGWTNAVNCFSNALSVRPNFPLAQLAMGGALANLGRAPDAATHFREALRLDPALLQARTNLDRLLNEHPEAR